MAGQALRAAQALCHEHRMISPGTHVLCAVSGGTDSVCLLHWLYGLRNQWGFTLTAAHYNHNLRGAESRRDADFVRSFVQTCCPEIALIVGSGDVSGHAAQNKAGIEETAREMRYAFLQQTALDVGADVIATAHNAEDNAETVLLHLMRGSGLRGLTGIPFRRGNIVRPLLTTRRAEIEEYMRRYGLPHVEDSSNADERFTRNRVRRQLIPLLEDMQPQFIEHVARTTQILAEDEECLAAQARQIPAGLCPISGGLSVDAAAIAGQPNALAVRIARLALDELMHDGGKCTSAHLGALVDLCRSDDPSACISLPNGILARRVYGKLELLYEESAQELTCTQLPLPGQLNLPGGVITTRRMIYASNPPEPNSFYLSCDKVDGLSVRPRRIGDTLSRPGRSGHTLKKILIDEKIPRHLRDSIPVLDCGGSVAAVVGLGPDSAFLPAPGEECWHITYTQTQKGSD